MQTELSLISLPDVVCTRGLPADWKTRDDKELTRETFEIPLNTPFSKKLCNFFQRKRFHLERVCRVENVKKWKEYWNNRILWSQEPENQASSHNECYLLHGCKPDSLKDIIDEGLDQRLSRQGRFGCGLYFTDDLEKAARYSSKQSPNKNINVLLCRVHLGDVKQYSDRLSDRSLKREPEKSAGSARRRYDSVMGRPKDAREFTIYASHKVYVEYVLTFSHHGMTAGFSRLNHRSDLLSSFDITRASLTAKRQQNVDDSSDSDDEKDPSTLISRTRSLQSTLSSGTYLPQPIARPAKPLSHHRFHRLGISDTKDIEAEQSDSDEESNVLTVAPRTRSLQSTLSGATNFPRSVTGQVASGVSRYPPSIYAQLSTQPGLSVQEEPAQVKEPYVYCEPPEAEIADFTTQQKAQLKKFMKEKEANFADAKKFLNGYKWVDVDARKWYDVSLKDKAGDTGEARKKKKEVQSLFEEFKQNIGERNLPEQTFKECMEFTNENFDEAILYYWQNYA